MALMNPFPANAQADFGVLDSKSASIVKDPEKDF